MPFPYTRWRWRKLNPFTSPPARFAASMAFDPVSGRILLFGGTGAGSVNDARNDTWTWDGSTWLELHPATSPPPRLGASMTLDSWSGHLLLFGGQAGIDRKSTRLNSSH